MAKIKKWHDGNEFLIWIVLATMVLRIPSLFEPYWYGDEGIYLVLGQALRKGLVWYSQIHDNKPPFLYLTAALSGNLMWFRLILLIWNAINVLVVGKLAEKIISHKWLVCLVAALFGILTALPWLEGNIANGELFMIMPTSAAILLLVNSKPRYLLVGLLFALGFLFKVPVVFDLVGVGLWFLFFRDGQEKLKGSFWVLIGFLMPILLTIIYYFIKGAGWAYVSAAFLQNVSYLSSWGAGSMSKMGSGSNTGLLVRGGVALITTALVWLLSKKEKAEVRLVFVWLVWALFGSLLSERPYPHYLIQIITPSVLLVGILIEKRNWTTWMAGMVLATLIIVAIFRYNFYFYPAIKYYDNFYRYLTKQISVQDYYQGFDQRVMQSYEVGKYLKLRTSEQESVFIWGDEPYVYALSDRLPPGRFTVAYHIVDFNGQTETLEAIVEKKPKYIVIMTTEKRQFRELFSYLVGWYTPTAQIGEALIYRRVE